MAKNVSNWMKITGEEYMPKKEEFDEEQDAEFCK